LHFDANHAQTEWGTRRVGNIRAQFTIESVEALRESYRKLGSQLLVSSEFAHEFYPKLLSKDKANIIVSLFDHNSIDSKYNSFFKEEMTKFAESNQIILSFETFWVSTIYHINDLDFNPLEWVPKNKAMFVDKTSQTPVRKLLPVPSRKAIPYLEDDERDEVIRTAENYMMSLEEMGLQPVVKDSRDSNNFKGGEEQGLLRLADFLDSKKYISNYAQTRKHLLGVDFSSKLSPWLSNGCLSIREVYFAVHNFEKKYGQTESTRKFL
jgi:deoxyribodipyrimidine photo-lyase